jgi:hypothetical protein
VSLSGDGLLQHDHPLAGTRRCSLSVGRVQFSISWRTQRRPLSALITRWLVHFFDFGPQLRPVKASGDLLVGSIGVAVA